MNEDQIKKLLSSFQAKQPPEAMMKDYEKEVLQKIDAGHGQPAFGLGLALGLALAVALAAGLGYWFYTQAPAPQESPSVIPLSPAIPAEAGIQALDSPVQQSVTSVPFSMPAPAEISDISLIEMTMDLFLLEMLGEDSGLLDDFDGFAVELDFMTSVA